MKTDIRKNWAARMAAIFVFCMVWVSAQGQTTTATLSGVVHDPTSAVVPQVRITLKNPVKGTVRLATTDPDGRYSFTSVEPGNYELRAESAGFRTEVKSGVVLTVGGSSQVDITLQVGPTNEIVTVTGETPLIEASKAEVSNVITQAKQKVIVAVMRSAKQNSSLLHEIRVFAPDFLRCVER